MKRHLLFFLMITWFVISSQAQMVGTNAKQDRVVIKTDNPKPKTVSTVHNVLSADFGYGIFDETYQFGCSYYYLRNWGFQAGVHYSGSYYSDGLLFSVGANKRLTDKGYLYVNIGLGPVMNSYTDYDPYYDSYVSTNALGIGVIFAVRNGITLNVETQMLGYDGDFSDDLLCLKIGFGIDLNRLFK